MVIDQVERRASVDGHAAKVAPDGEAVCVVTSSGLVVRVPGETSARATLASPGVTVVLWSPDGRHLVAQAGLQVHVWEVASGRTVGTFTVAEESTISALGRGGTTVAGSIAGGANTRSAGIVRAVTWDVSTGNEGQPAPDLSVPDGRYRAISSGDGILIVAHRQTGKEAFRIPTNDTFGALDQDGRYLATRSGNDVNVWALTPADLIAQACRRLSRNLTPQEWQDYVGDEPYRKTCGALP
jgi:WD40 repeat protein